MNFVKKIIYGNKISELLESGIEFFENGNYFSAVNCFTHILDFNKKNEDALFHRGNTYLKLKNYNKAQIDLEMLESINSEYNPKLSYLLAKTYQFQGDNKRAVKYADKYYSANPNDPQSLYFSARSKYFDGALDESFNYTELLLSRNIDDFNIRYLRSLISFSKENFISAIIDIDKAIELESFNGFAYNLRGLININLLNYKDAIDDFDSAIRLNPANANYFFNKAKIQMKIGDLIDAKTSAENAVELDPENKTFHLLKAELELLAENHIEALEAYQSAYNLDPSDLKLLECTSGLKTYLCDFEGAIADLLKIVDVEKDAEIYFKIAFLYYKLNKENEALKKLEKAINIDPKYKDALLQKGILNYWTQNYKESIKVFDSLSKLEPQFTKPMLYKARALMKMGLSHQAAETLAQIDESEREEEFLLLNSQINYLDNNFSEAHNYLNKFKEHKGENNSTKIIDSFLSIRTDNISSVNELNEFDYENSEKENVQLLNAVLSYKKCHYNTAKFRLSNILDSYKRKKAHIQPLIAFAENQIKGI